MTGAERRRSRLFESTSQRRDDVTTHRVAVADAGDDGIDADERGSCSAEEDGRSRPYTRNYSKTGTTTCQPR